ncbi:MAG: chaperonin GroEL [Deltaproteobacteria bacterium]|nr:chaperonin GroEL [Deltaproteobacteria bacterium]
MAAKDFLFHESARTQLARGLDTLANAVKVTLGPRGKNVVIDKAWGAPTITKDGVTVAKEIELENHFANLGAQMVKEVAAKTAEVAGDGTTTATVLAQAIFTEGGRLLAAGLDPMELKRGIDAAVEVVVADLARQSTPIRSQTEIAQIGSISANGDQAIGDLLARAMAKVGKDGVITVEEARGMETTLDVVEGMQFDRGYLSAYFVTDAEKMTVVLDEPYVLLHELRIAKLADLLPLLELVAQSGKPLLIIAEDVEGEALATLVVNKLRGALKVCAVKAPGFGERRRDSIEDLAAITGAQAITADRGDLLVKTTLAELGRARTITITKDDTTIVDGAGTHEAITLRANAIRGRLEHTTEDHDRDQLQARLAKLVGGVAVLKLGAATEPELKERQARVEDALHATRAAVQEGIVAGGGVALVRAAAALDALVLTGDQRLGVQIVRRALEEPLRQIAVNAGEEGAVVAARVQAGTGPFGYNAATGVYEDLVAAGVIDPTKVVRVALQNAASVASLMLTTEAMVVVQSAPQTAGVGVGIRGGQSGMGL